MKKFILLASLWFGATGAAYSAGGSTPDWDEKIWRSTRTGTGELFNSTFASGPVVIGSIIISSPSSTINSYMRVMKSTSATYDPLTASTGPYVITNGSNESPVSPGEGSKWNTVSSSWTYLDKRGNADIQILWDWLDSWLANPTQSLP